MQNLPEDFNDMITCLLELDCDFVIVGAYAMAANGYERATQDIDILVNPENANAEKVFNALVLFGAPVKSHGVAVEDFTKEGNVYQIGLPPNRIDLLTSINGVSYEEAKEDFIFREIGNHRVSFLGIQAQIKNKLSTGRLKDAADAEALLALVDMDSDK